MTSLLTRSQTATARDTGVATFIRDYCAVSAGCRVVLAYSPDAYEPATWVVGAMRQQGVEVTVLTMDPTSDDTFAERLAAAIGPLTPQRPVTLVTMERDTMSHLHDIKTVLQPFPTSSWRTVRLINASEEVFTHAMRMSPERISRANASLLHSLLPATRLRVTSAAGTDLAIELDNCRYRWLSSRGSSRAGGFVVLPPGEISTFPASVTGTLVADGAFNLNAKTALDARLVHAPVTAVFDRNTLVSATSADADVRRLLARVATFDNASLVGELGIGTNHGNPGFIAMNSHINERRPGVHIGLGQHNQGEGVLDFYCPLHLDLIMDGGQIEVLDSGLVIDTSAEPSVSLPHPADVMDEDIDADCCGLLRAESR